MRTFLDSNILLYLVGHEGSIKKKIVKNLISPDQFISTQVIAENVNVCLKKFHMDKQLAFSHGKNLLQKFTVLTIEKPTLEKSFLISNTYNLSFWDSLIIATALHADCTILYSEDMQNGLLIEKSLTIKNPFKNS